MRILHTIVAALVSAALLQAAPNFSGDWKLSVQKSVLGEGSSVPQKSTHKITHEDPKLKVIVDQVSERGEFHVELNYTTDGKECTNEIMGTPVKTTVKWDGDALVFHTAGTFNDNPITLDDRWTMDADGKVLTINRHFKSGDRERDQKLVFEK
ncbi:MAG: hypothetical protein LLG20_23225 [Acidobacteriales bacterium]|nr:hypothetical protein [Terriglobales bacterium]